MTTHFQARKATGWLLGGLLGSVVACGSTREAAVKAPSADAIEVASPNSVPAGRPGIAPPRAAAPASPADGPIVVARAVPPKAAPAPSIAAPAAPRPGTTARPATHVQSGRIIDEAGQPIVGATVLLKGTAKGTSTDASGGYSLEVPNGENTFVVGYGGYEDETATSRDGQPLNVTLLPTPDSKAPTTKAKSRRERR